MKNEPKLAERSRRCEPDCQYCWEIPDEHHEDGRVVHIERKGDTVFLGTTPAYEDMCPEAVPLELIKKILGLTP